MLREVLLRRALYERSKMIGITFESLMCSACVAGLSLPLSLGVDSVKCGSNRLRLLQNEK